MSNRTEIDLARSLVDQHHDAMGFEARDNLSTRVWHLLVSLERLMGGEKLSIVDLAKEAREYVETCD